MLVMCRKGRHRSVALATLLGWVAEKMGYKAPSSCLYFLIVKTQACVSVGRGRSPGPGPGLSWQRGGSRPGPKASSRPGHEGW